MPYVTIEWLSGRSHAQKRKVAKALAQAMVKHTNVKAENIVVIFRDLDARDSFVGPDLLTQPPRSVAARGTKAARPRGRR
jgi:4-oxalocrotonate tautomerase family enzyme